MNNPLASLTDKELLVIKETTIKNLEARIKELEKVLTVFAEMEEITGGRGFKSAYLKERARRALNPKSVEDES